MNNKKTVKWDEQLEKDLTEYHNLNAKDELGNMLLKELEKERERFEENP